MNTPIQTPPILITTEPTPNPQSMTFRVNLQLVDTPTDFPSVREADRSPLASKIFGFPWASGVYLGKDFITITKQDWVDWDVLSDPLRGLIQEHIENGEPILLAPTTGTATTDFSAFDPSDSPEVRRIKEVLEYEVRPAVAQDGGDIIFHRYENKKVYVYMKGACSGCPSSTYTLKVGIETRLKEALPEIEEVIAL